MMQSLTSASTGRAAEALEREPIPAQHRAGTSVVAPPPVDLSEDDIAGGGRQMIRERHQLASRGGVHIRHRRQHAAPEHGDARGSARFGAASVADAHDRSHIRIDASGEHDSAAFVHGCLAEQPLERIGRQAVGLVNEDRAVAGEWRKPGERLAQGLTRHLVHPVGLEAPVGAVADRVPRGARRSGRSP